MHRTTGALSGVVGHEPALEGRTSR